LRTAIDFLGARLAPRARPALRALARAAADLVFPPECLACRQATAAHGSLCAACWAKVRFIQRPFCERLGVPFAVDLGAEGLLSPEAVAIRRSMAAPAPSPISRTALCAISCTG
jgi:hypothetical protein